MVRSGDFLNAIILSSFQFQFQSKARLRLHSTSIFYLYLRFPLTKQLFLKISNTDLKFCIYFALLIISRVTSLATPQSVPRQFNFLSATPISSFHPSKIQVKMTDKKKCVELAVNEGERRKSGSFPSSELVTCWSWAILCLLVFLESSTRSATAEDQRGTTWNTADYFKREHSLTKPYQGSGWLIPNWDFVGSTIVTNQYVRLTPDTRSQQGALWNSIPIRMRNWEIQIQFKVHGKGKDLFGDGLVFWYVRDRMQLGPAFGSKDFFYGLAVLIDTYSNYNGPHNHGHPYISTMVNNGSLHYDHDRDGTHTQLAGCEAKVRNLQHDTWMSIRYENDVLSVSTDINGKNAWEPCVRVEGITLPTGYFIGLSAATGDLSDNHDIIAVKTYELTPHDAAGEIARDHVLPSALSYDPPREFVDEPKSPGWSGVKVFFVTLAVLLVIAALGVVGVIWYQNHQHNSRKRFY